MDTTNRDALDEETNGGEEISPRSTSTVRESESPNFEDIQLPSADGEGVELPAAGRRTSSVELSRIETYRLQHRSTVGSTTGPAPEEEWLPIGSGKPYPPQLPHPEEYVVEFTGEDDPLHPHNWPSGKKVAIAAIMAYSTFVASFCSSIFSSTTSQVNQEFGVSTEVSTLGVTLYVLGFAAGPIIWAPASELSGRRWPVTIGLFGYSIFSIATATAKDFQTVMLTRFFSGLFAAAPLATVPAVYADIYDHAHRGIAVALFAVSVFVGPFAAPWIGAFITESYLGWRWTMYISSFMGWFAFVLLLLFFRETYAPVVLVEKAAILRRQTRNWGIHARQDEIEVDVHELLTNNFGRPFRMLFTEPIVLLFSLYMSFIYGLMYALLGAYPVVFQGIYDMSSGVGSLPFIGLMIGEFLGGVYALLAMRTYAKKLRANNNVPVPEWRLPPCVVGGVVFAIGMFWFGWTGFTQSVHWMAPTASGLAVGFGIFSVFLQCFNYLVDSYLTLAASVFAANTIMRSAVGATFPLFSRQLFRNLGVQWAGTLVGCIAVIMIPIPIVFIVLGPKLRGMSQFAPAGRRMSHSEKTPPPS